MRIGIIVADESEKIRNQIVQGLDTKHCMMYIADVVSNIQDLKESVVKYPGSLVILGQEMVYSDLTLTIDEIRALDSDVSIIVTSYEQDFKKLRQAYRNGVLDWWIKPLNFYSMNERLNLISKQIREITPEQIKKKNFISMQSLYFWETMYEQSNMFKDVNFVNSIMGVKFRPGCYRVLFFRLDMNEGQTPEFRDGAYYLRLNEIQTEMEIIIHTVLFEYCYEIIYDFRFNGVLTILNYNEDMDSAILYQLDDIQKLIQKKICDSKDMQITLCVGGVYGMINEVMKSREEAYKCSWARMKKGTNKVLYYKNTDDIQLEYQEKLKKINDDLISCADTLDKKWFNSTVDILFCLPAFILTHNNTKEIIDNFIAYFYHCNEQVLSTMINIEIDKEYTRKILNFAASLDEYQRKLKERFNRLFDMLVDTGERYNIRPVRTAIQFIKNHYDSQITAEGIAEIVNFNPVYFSHVFKTQTGINMTEYINNYRIEVAKKKLWETNETIYEIATSVGFHDQRYFSKRFRMATGMSPSEYRKKK